MDSSVTKDQATQQAINTLEGFFSLIDSGKLFTHTDELFYRELRRDVHVALSHLLVWGRPTLEASRGLHWPYEEINKRYPAIRELAQGKEAGFQKTQARLCLALLPFPSQWSWLLAAEEQRRQKKEVDEFLCNEKGKVDEKLQNRPLKVYKLRHFSQVLKRPQDGEKGVLRIHSMPYLFSPDSLRTLSRRYILYVEPPQGVVFRYTWLRSFSVLEDPCVLGVGSTEDLDFLENQPRIEPIPLAHGDYLLESVRVPLNRRKEYDIVFNATFDELRRKRHELMLEFLQHDRLIDTKALFLGKGQERHIEQFKSMVRQAGLENRITTVANVPRSEVPTYLSLCKIGVHLSLYENCCRCVYEFFRSNLPCVVPSSMGGMNLGIFNAKTGMAVTDKELPEAIAFVLRHWDRFTPRRWFLENSGSSHSSHKLNRFLRKLFEKRGYPWREDIVPLQSSGPSRYVNSLDYEHFREEFLWLKDCLMVSGNVPIEISVD